MYIQYVLLIEKELFIIMTTQQIVRPRSCVEPPPGVNANQAAISLMVLYFHTWHGILFSLTIFSIIRQWPKHFGPHVVTKWPLNAARQVQIKSNQICM
jgi:hypothetical protein